MEYKFKYDQDCDFDNPVMKKFLENLTHEEKIASDIAMQVGLVCSRINNTQTHHGISDDDLAKKIEYLQNCININDKEGFDYDLNTSTLLMYAAAMSATLKITLEFEDGEQAELL